MTTSLKLVAIGTLLGTLGVGVVLRYGTVYMFIGYVTALVTIYTVLGLRWLWKSAPTVSSALAVRMLLRVFWTMFGVLAGLALVAWLYLSTSTFWLLPLPFFFPALLCTMFYERTFRRVGNLPFWKKGL